MEGSEGEWCSAAEIVAIVVVTGVELSIQDLDFDYELIEDLQQACDECVEGLWVAISDWADWEWADLDWAN